jgi:spermidine synthase
MEKTTGKRPMIFALFFVSGITGLVYEVAWTRMFVTVFGSTTHAVSTVLAAFMAGLALGSIILGRYGDRFKRPVLVYGVLEVLVGIYALLVPWIIGALGGVYSGVFEAFGQQPLPVAIIRFLLSFVVILIPTTLMGGTLPILSRFAGSEFARLGRSIGALYAVNTFGAVIGSFVTGFFLLELIGVSASVYLAAVASILVGLAAAGLGRGIRVGVPTETPGTTGEERPVPAYVGTVVLLAIGVSGGAALAYEVIYTKVLVFSLGATAHAFSLMLTTFLIGLAVGSYLSSRLVDRWRRPTNFFGLVEVMIGLAALASVYFLSKLELTYRLLDLKDSGADLFRLRGAGFLQAATVMLVPSIFMGAAFPIVTRIYATRQAVSGSVGRIYFFNTLGAVTGSLLAGFALVPALGSARSLALVASFNVAAGLLLLSCKGKRRFWSAAAAAALAGLIVVAYAIRPSVFAGTFNIREEGSQLIYFKEGVSGTVTVHRYPDYDLLAIDGVNVAGTSQMLRVTQKLQGHLPILLAEAKDKVAHIGFGSGETLRILTVHGAGTIDGIEICKDVITAARRFFSALNRLVFDRPNVNILVMDGKNFVLMTPDRYDIIMTDSIYPGTGGASALYTYDHFRAVSDKLKPGGVASCWLPLDLSPEDLRIALRAFHDAFPNMSVWYFYMTFSQHALLVGKKDAQIAADLPKLEAAFEDSVIGEDLRSILIDDPYVLVSCLLADGDAVGRFCEGAPRHSDDHPVLEFGLARRGAAKAYLSRNLERLLALRPDPLDYVSGLEDIGPDPDSLAERIEEATALSAHITRGHIMNAVGETGRARAEYTKALASDPDNRIALYALASLDDALSSMERASQSGAQGYELAYALGLRYLAEARFEQALEQLERALQLRPDLPDPHVSIGECYLRWGRPDEALGHFQSALRILPGDPGILLRLGMAYADLDRTDEAVRAYEAALASNPDDYDVRLALGSAHLREGRIADAREHFRHAALVAPDRPHGLFNLGLTFAAERDWESARDCFQKAVSEVPDFVPAHFQLGNVLLVMGDEDGARQAWQKTLELNPAHQMARQRLEALDTRSEGANPGVGEGN